MNPRVRDKLKKLALESEGIRGKFRIAAGVVYKGRLVCTGVASYKTHPILMNGDYRPEQIYHHAESSALVRAQKVLTPEQLSASCICVVRVLKDGSFGLAKPCAGCLGLITKFGITNVLYTTGDN